MIGLVIDSSSQIPQDLIDTYDVEVVPITVTIDEEPFREGVDIDADAFYEMVEEPLPEIGTSQPSPGEFVEAYEALAARGATEILCVTVADQHSGTFNSARIAADLVALPVRLVNSGTMSFGVTACFWEAAAAIAEGAELEAAATLAEALAPTISSTFFLQSLEQVRKMGRVDLDRLSSLTSPTSANAPNATDSQQADQANNADEVSVYVTRGADFDVAGSTSGLISLCELMLAQVPTDQPVRTGVCLAAPEMLPYAELLEKQLATQTNVVGTVRYRVGPSVAAHTGPGTAGLFWWPAN